MNYYGNFYSLTHTIPGLKRRATAPKIYDINSVASRRMPVSERDERRKISYDNLLFTYNRSKRHRGSDYIRGDLPLAGDIPKGWFAPAVNPSADLNQGAMRFFADNSQFEQYDKLYKDYTGTDAPSANVRTFLHQRPPSTHVSTDLYGNIHVYDS